ncbi:MAG: COX15/CtaA family protein [Sandaracinaceae bacterium]|nr:COX15/CtaA family protein [Sandaracinaceae bacterium]
MKAVARWLLVVCALIVAMVAVGGITRLTNSGLSIVEWAPIVGIIPPTNDQTWQHAFAQYKQYPQYQMRTTPMELAEFKSIFFWEYAHRLLGRLIGLAFFIPWGYFMLRRRIASRTSWQLAGVGLLGAVQGGIGWYMVKSGLQTQPHVSHYRLALHLVTALTMLGWLAYVRADLLAPSQVPDVARPNAARGLRNVARLLLVVLTIQIIYGAFVAGLHAGYIYNTWPTMYGQWFPSASWDDALSYRNWIDNPAVVQFVHRVVAYVFVVLVTIFCAYAARVSLRSATRQWIYGVGVLTLVQVGLGIATLLTLVTLPLAALHQTCGALLVATLSVAIHGLRTPRVVLDRETEITLTSELNAPDSKSPSRT